MDSFVDLNIYRFRNRPIKLDGELYANMLHFYAVDIQMQSFYGITLHMLFFIGPTWHGHWSALLQSPDNDNGVILLPATTSCTDRFPYGRNL